MIKQKLYKINILILKILPLILALFYFLWNVLYALGVSIKLFSYLGSLSIIPAIFILISSKTFEFCVTHRIPIYFILTVNLINYVLSLVMFSISVKWYLTILSSVLLLFILLIIVFKYKENAKSNKESIK